MSSSAAARPRRSQCAFIGLSIHRELLIADAPDTYYVSDYYERYPLVLVRLGSIGRDALRDPFVDLMASHGGEDSTRSKAADRVWNCSRQTPICLRLR
jgi:hypothetical protein